MDASRLITAVTVVRNGMPYIEETLKSFLSQSIRVSVLVIDDHSTDATEAAVKKFPSIRYVKNTNESGQVGARNLSLSLISTPYTAWLDADDVWEGRFAELVLRAFDLHPDAVMVTTGTTCIDKHGRPLSLFDSYQRKYRIPKYRENPNQIVPGDSVEFAVTRMRQRWAWGAHAFKTEAVRRAGGFRPGLVYAVDYDMIARVLSVGKAVHIPANLSRYRRHSTSVTHVYQPSLIYAEKLGTAVKVGEISGVLTKELKKQLELVSRFKCKVHEFLREKRLKTALGVLGYLLHPRLILYFLRMRGDKTLL